MYNFNNDFANSTLNNPVPDPNGILTKNKFVKKTLDDVGQVIKSDLLDINGIDLDDEDISNLMNWYSSYQIAYSYPTYKHKLSKKWEGIFENINENKGKSDIMGLVEISIGRLLQNEFEEKGYYVRVRKTSNFDDITSGIDYVVEFKDDKGKINEILGIDFTISEIGADSLLKNLKKEAHPTDYKLYYEKKYNKKLKEIPRIVMSLSRDLAYSFTNNFFTEILEKGQLLDNENIQECLTYAIEDIKNIKIGSKKFVVSNRVEQTNAKVNYILKDF